MQSGKILLPLLGAIVMGVGASLLAGRIMTGSHLSADGQEDGTDQKVVVAATNIAYGEEITADKLDLQSVAASFARPDMLHSLEEVSGKIATGDIFQGEPVISQRIADKQAGSMLASLVNDHMRAVSVRVNDVIGVAGFLLPGNRVDVLASRMEGGNALTGTVLQNIKVLAVDQTVAASKDAPVVVRAVTLEVAPQDAEKLFQAMQEGSIHLTLRNPVDANVVDTRPDVAPTEDAPPLQASPPDMAIVAAPVPDVPAEETVPPAPSVTIIRGTTINKIVLPGGGN